MIQKNIQEKVEATLHSIDGITRAEIPAFFYTRVQAKLTNQASSVWWQRLLVVATKPIFYIATLSVFLLLNITVITTIIKEKKLATTIAESTTIQGFAQEYNLSTTTIYTDK